MDEGIYERLITKSLRGELDSTDLSVQTTKVDAADNPFVVARHVSDIVLRTLSAIKQPGDQIALANRILESLDAPQGSVLTQVN